MSNNDHFKLTKKKVNAWNKWREEHPEEIPDLSNFRLVRADLSGFNLDHTNFKGADLSEALLDGATLVSADLSDAILRQANLNCANLSSANLEKSKFENADLRKAVLSGANLNCVKADNALLEESDLEGAYIQNSSFKYAKLEGANFSRAELQEAKFNGANLKGTKFNGANLQKVNLTEANLSGAGFGSANLESADLTRANLSETDFKDARLTNAILTEADLKNSKGFRLDSTIVRFTNFDARSSDPWSILRRKYSGPMFLFHIIFLLVFLGTFSARAFLWVGVNKAQDGLATSQERFITKVHGLAEADALAKEEMRNKLLDLYAENNLRLEIVNRANAIVKEGLRTSNLQFKRKTLEEVTGIIANVQPCLRTECQDEQPIWRVLVRWEVGNGNNKPSLFPFFLAAALIIYQVLRGWLTWYIGLLRDAEERSGSSPAYSDYKHAAFIHTWVMNPLFIIAVVALVYNAYIVLFQTTVILPLA